MRNGSRRSTLLTLLILLALPVAALAAPVAEMEVSPNMVTWRPTGEFHKLSLTVVGPDGQRLERTVDGAGVVALSTVEKVAGFKWTEGTYKYELRTVAAPRERGVDKAAPEGPVQSGSFMIVDGALVTPREEPTVKDQVIPDDLIVQSSICVGFDCVNNENFGFDTIRLKENNTRIKFEDTSAGTFPSTDWQLTANDSASGGQNRFSIEDITAARVPFTVEGGATTNSLYVDSTGRVGFRTSTPVLDLHVNTSNTPGLRLEQNNSGGFSAQTWDVAGNEANFFVRDVTNGSLLSFRIRPGAPSSSLDINSDGDVGVGVATANAKLHVQNSGATEILVQQNGTASDDATIRLLNNSSAGANGQAWVFNHRGTNASFLFNYTGSAGNEFSLDTAGNLTILGTLTENSDRTKKEAIVPVDPSAVLAQVARLPIASWSRIGETSRHLGPMAQDFHALFGLGVNDTSIATIDTSGVALAAIQGLNQVVEQKDAEIADLQSRLAALEQLVARLAAE